MGEREKRPFGSWFSGRFFYPFFENERPKSAKPVPDCIPESMRARFLALSEAERRQIEDQLPALLERVQGALQDTLSKAPKDRLISFSHPSRLDDGAEIASSIFLDDMFSRMMSASVQSHNNWLLQRQRAGIPSDKQDS